MFWDKNLSPGYITHLAFQIRLKSIISLEPILPIRFDYVAVESTTERPV